ncbi:MAG: cation:proton antiporter [Bacilli bacterium]|nr:cation:proton antiporter [Bacilli bacterium]
MTRLLRYLKLPNVTAYLLAGLIVGPGVVIILHNSFGVFSNNFINEYKDTVNSLSVLTDIALGFIALSIGAEFKWGKIKHMGKKILIITVVQAVTTTILVDAALLLLMKPLNISVGLAITLGAIATATAPAATLMVVRQYNASGPVVNTLLPVVAFDDAVGLMVFSLSFNIAKVYESGASLTVLAVLVSPILEILLSLLIGFICGFIMTLLCKFFKSRANTLAMMIGFAVLCVALSKINFNFGPEIHFNLSSLLVCMMLGATYCNMRKDCDRYLQRVDEFTAPLFTLFFVISGASIDLTVLNSWNIVIVTLVYLLFRSIGKYSGAYIGGAISKAEPNVKKYLGITLLPQAGVAIGMANVAKASFGSDGVKIYTIALCATFVYELIGPVLTKIALEKAGEIPIVPKIKKLNKQNI